MEEENLFTKLIADAGLASSNNIKFWEHFARDVWAPAMKIEREKGNANVTYKQPKALQTYCSRLENHDVLKGDGMLFS